MNLNDIKPEKNNVFYHRLAAKEYRARFIDPRTDAVRRGMLYRRSCVVCGSKKESLLFKKDGLRFVECERCAFVFINPYIKAEHKEEYYKASKAFSRFFTDVVIRTREKRFALIWRDRVEKIRQYVQRGHVLDVGCGSGEFLESLVDAGFDSLLGIEPNKAAADFAAERVPGCVRNEVFEKMKLPDGHYSLVTMWEVLSHFNDPRQVCATLARAMTPGGILVISSPNFAGFEYQILGPAHNDVSFKIANYFSPRTMSRLLERAGFEILDVTTPGRLDVQHVERNARLMPDKVHLDGFIRSIVMDDSDAGVEKRTDLQAFLRKHLLSGSMLMVARKAA